MKSAIVALLEELDPHSTFISKEEVDEANSSINGSFVGIGIRFQILKDTLMVVATIPGGPSEKLGIRPGEKIHEEMISSSDSFFTYDLGKYYAIIPQSTNWPLSEFVSNFNAKKVSEGFSYNSLDNEEWETVESLRKLIELHVTKNI